MVNKPIAPTSTTSTTSPTSTAAPAARRPSVYAPSNTQFKSREKNKNLLYVPFGSSTQFSPDPFYSTQCKSPALLPKDD